MFTLKNNTKLTLIHKDYKLLPGETITVPDNVGKIWLLINGIVEYKDPQEAKQETKELKQKNEELKKQIEELKKEVQKPKTQTKKTSTSKKTTKAK